jgi:hypothetical protein
MSFTIIHRNGPDSNFETKSVQNHPLKTEKKYQNRTHIMMAYKGIPCVNKIRQSRSQLKSRPAIKYYQS